MPIARGVSLGPYEILAHIGAGGMGDVWRARDRRLGRDVAVKVLPGLGGNEAQVQRFELEARAAGALNHPGLVTIFDVGSNEGAPYIVMELLQGQTLRQAIGDDEETAPLPLRKAVDYATQIATALSVAHEKGIVHRDLKPENIFITSEGRVKILDFGLAKLAEDATDVDGRRRTARHLTSAGMVVGTPGYMSPEQVRARPLDYRTDIFALGSVLYEMLSGRRAFDRRSAVETMHAVLEDDPAPLPESVPAPLEAIVQHCMEKDPRDRFQSARDLAFQLGMLKAFSAPTSPGVVPLPPMPRRFPYRVAAAVLVGLLVLAAGGYALYRLRGAAPQTPLLGKYQQLTFGDGLSMFPTLSPDGKIFAYVSSRSGNRDIYVQRIDGHTPLDITADSPADDSEPAFSPDGSQIAFRSERDGGGIYVMGVMGESPRRLTNFGHNPSWSPDGTRLVIAEEKVELHPQIRTSNSRLWIVSLRDGTTRPLVQRGVDGPDFGRASDSVQPSWSPHGKRIAFWGKSNSAGQRDLWTIDPDAPQPKRTVVRVTSDPALHWNPVWSPDGRYLYYGSDANGTLNLWRVPMNEDAGTPAGAPELLSLPAAWSGHFAFSAQGEMVFTALTRSYALCALPFDAASGRTGPPRTLFGGTQEILTFDLSPDGKSVAFTTGGAQEDVFIANIDGTHMRQLTNDEARDRVVTWSPNGKTLYFYSNRGGPYQIWSVRTDGSGLARITDPSELKRVLGGGQNVYAPAASPDGRALAAQTDVGLDVIVHLDRPAGQQLEKIDGSLRAPQWSPDGTQLVGERADGDGLAIYSLASRHVEKLLDHGNSPRWLPDGRHVVFFEAQGIGVIDAGTRQTTLASAQEAAVELTRTPASPRLSRDGSTLYARKTSEIGDIWLAHLQNREGQ